jgi:hypothetical protein
MRLDGVEILRADTETPQGDVVLAALETRVNLAPRNGFQARFSALGVRRLARAATLAAERSLASLSR